MITNLYNTFLIPNSGYKSLPIAGIDGTLKTRMKSGHEVAFTIMNQNILSAAKVRAFQDRVCKIIAEQ